MVYDKINLFCPTYKRHDTKLPKFIRSAARMAGDTKNICFTFVVNESDKATIDTIASLLDNVAEYHVILENTEKPNLAAYFNMAYSMTRFKEDTTVVSMLGDDMEFRTPRWDELVLQWVNMFNGVGLFFGDDCKGTGEFLAVNFFTTRRYVDAARAPFMCEMFPIDDMDVVHDQLARYIKRRYYVEKLRIFHNHATLPGQMDYVWRRLRTRYKEVVEARAKAPEYIRKLAGKVRKNLAGELEAKIVPVMTTCDRLGLLKKTAQSYIAPIEVDNETYIEWYGGLWEDEERSTGKPEKLYVYDDCSEEPEKIEEMFGKHAEVIHGDRKMGCAAKTPAVLRDVFSNTDAEAVVVLDSDTQFYKYWWTRLISLYKKHSGRDDFGCVSLFNSQNTDGVACPHDSTLVRKISVGAFGTLYTKDFWEKYIKPFGDSPPTNWDHQACVKAIEDGKVVLASSPSFLQHTGTSEGTHAIGGVNTTYAVDFLGRVDQPDTVGDGEGVLVSLMGRAGDIILGSFIVNMLRVQGYKIAWETITAYKDLVKLVCPGAKVIAREPGSDVRWCSTSTDEMRRRCPGYKYYVNLQPGAPENHARLFSSGMHMADFTREIAENAVGTSLPDEYLKYSLLDRLPRVDFAEFITSKPLAIIAPGVLSIPTALDEADVERLYEEYNGEYNAKILVEKRPQGMASRAIREKYLFGYTFEQCVHILQKAALFIGNDSGLAWAALLSKDCKKIIYHHRRRLEQTNVWYEQLDPNAKDVVVEGKWL